MKIRSCIVLGAGIAGLTVADKLSDAGIQVTLLEKDPTLGGLCRRVMVDGAGVDLGPHNLRTMNPEILSYWHTLIGSDLLPRKFTGKIFFNRDLLNYPVSPFEIMRKLPLRILVRATFDLITAKIKSKLFKANLETFEQWTVANYGRELYQTFFKPLTEKIWSVPPASLDASYAKKRIPPFSIRRTLLRLAPKKGSHSEDPGATREYYPKYGVYEFCESIKARLDSKQVRVETGVNLESISEDADAVKVQCRDSSGVNLTLSADFIVSSIPIEPLLKLYGDRGASTGSELKYRGVALYYISVPKHARLPAPVVYCADADIPFNRASDFLSFSEDVCPPGRNIICFEFHAESRETAELEKHGKKIVDFVAGNGLFDVSTIYAEHYEYAPFVYPLYLKGYRQYLKAVFQKLMSKKRLLSIGRQGLFTHINVDRVMEIAIEGAKLVLGDVEDRSKVSQFYTLE